MPVSAQLLGLRANLLQAVREFFVAKGYLEVDTPLRLPALVPEGHVEPLASESWFLQTSPELCMKRLLASGLPKIFQICKCFRKNERGHRHLPEMTMLEWYEVHKDYNSLMDDCEALLLFIAQRLFGQDIIVWEEKEIDLSPPWERLTLAEAFTRFAPLSLTDAISDDRFEDILVEFVEPNLGQQKPAFIYEYPKSLASLARNSPRNSEVAERLELYVAGVELANGFSELTDSAEQRHRFELERQVIAGAGRKLTPMPEKFLDDLQTMPDAAGIALGVDRLVMLFTNCQDIGEVVAFVPEDL